MNIKFWLKRNQESGTVICVGKLRGDRTFAYIRMVVVITIYRMSPLCALPPKWYLARAAVGREREYGNEATVTCISTILPKVVRVRCRELGRVFKGQLM